MSEIIQQRFSYLRNQIAVHSNGLNVNEGIIDMVVVIEPLLRRVSGRLWHATDISGFADRPQQYYMLRTYNMLRIHEVELIDKR